MQRSLSWILWLAAVGFFMQTLDTTIVNTALPAMARSLGESPLEMQSVVISYSLTMAILIPASGWIADRWGTRKVFFTAIVLFTLGSQLCASSRTLTQLVLARVIQASGGAMLAPVGRLAVLRAFPRSEFLRAMSFVTVPGLVGPLVGPTLGGWLVQIASWHWVYLINLPIGIAGAVATWFRMPDYRGPKRRFDVIGYGLLAAGMLAVSLALDGLSDFGFRKATVVVLLVFGLAGLVAYGLHATRAKAPMFSLKLFGIPTFRVGLLGNLFARLGSSSMPFLLPLLLQLGLGESAFRAGLTMIPVALAGIFAKSLGVPIVQRFGYRPVLVGNTMLVGASMASFALMGPGYPLWLAVVQLAIFGATNSFQFTAMNSLTLKDLSTDEASDGNGMLAVVQMLAMSLGVAAAGSLLVAFASPRDGGTTATAFRATFVCVGLLTTAAAAIFWQLDRDTRPDRAVAAPDHSSELG